MLVKYALRPARRHVCFAGVPREIGKTKNGKKRDTRGASANRNRCAQDITSRPHVPRADVHRFRQSKGEYMSRATLYKKLESLDPALAAPLFKLIYDDKILDARAHGGGGR
jgi:hypothetical protein